MKNAGMFIINLAQDLGGIGLVSTVGSFALLGAKVSFDCSVAAKYTLKLSNQMVCRTSYGLISARKDIRI